jgi:hypothetical protein
MPAVDLGGQLCRLEEILNQRIQNDLMLSRGPLVDGRLLATSVWPVPANIATLRLYLLIYS